MMHAELEGIVCSGKRRGQPFTYALLEEIRQKSKAFNKEEALAELAKRYFQSRGPATKKIFQHGLALTLKNAHRALK
jgi:hypothetical protein